MKRKEFLKSLAFLPLIGSSMNLKHLESLSEQFESSETMPVLFAGHGNPMNAIESNAFSNKWKEMGKALPPPSAILCISAHWETNGTWVTAMEHPSTIHDFGGFPQALYEVEYPAPGNPALAKETASLLQNTPVNLDLNWGLDHGTWSIIKNIYPKADIPVIQLSLDYSKSAVQHYEIASQLVKLRNKGVLILGSGNMVHNLRLLDWNHPQAGSDWALEANEIFKELIIRKDHHKLVNYKELGKAVQLSVPTPEHYLPLLYVLALRSANEEISFFNDQAVMGSLTMTSVWIGDGA